MIFRVGRPRRALSVVSLVLGVTTLSGLRPHAPLVTKTQWYPEIPRQGDVLHIVVSTPEEGIKVRATFLGTDLPFFRVPSDPDECHAIGGVDSSQPPGAYELVVSARKGEGIEEKSLFQVTVEAREFPEEHLTLPEEKVVLSPRDQRRVEKEQKRISSLFRTVTPERLWQGGFLMPVNGELGSPFGWRRVINGRPRKPHSGQDIRAPASTPVLSSNQGRVALVGDFFFEGNSVFIDHGQGIYTMYFHLSRIHVREGALVRRGDTLGWVGSTGRATGPHLHWGTRISGARVDPLLLVKTTAHFVK